MNGRHERDSKPEPDPKHPPCGYCSSPDTEGHCGNPRCTWVKCKTCHRISDTRRLRNQGNT